jgi:hypothetical protein
MPCHYGHGRLCLFGEQQGPNWKKLQLVLGKGFLAQHTTKVSCKKEICMLFRSMPGL